MTWQRYLSRHHHARRPLGSLSTGEARAVARAECFIGYGSRVAVKEDWIEISGLPASPVICDSLSPPLRYTERGETTSIRWLAINVDKHADRLGSRTEVHARLQHDTIWSHFQHLLR